MEEEMPFEDAFRRLEDAVRALEAGGLTLEEALALYEEGVRLARLCEGRLDAAQLRLTRLQPPPEGELNGWEDADEG